MARRGRDEVDAEGEIIGSETHVIRKALAGDAGIQRGIAEIESRQLNKTVGTCVEGL